MVIRQRKEFSIINRMNFLKLFNINALLQMSEFSKFKDGHLLPVDYTTKFDKDQVDRRRQAIARIEINDEYREEKFLVDSIACTGQQGSPTCFYDFTSKIRLVDMLVFQPVKVEISNEDHFYPTT